jgi:hypothetical protein
MQVALKLVDFAIGSETGGPNLCVSFARYIFFPLLSLQTHVNFVVIHCEACRFCHRLLFKPFDRVLSVLFGVLSFRVLCRPLSLLQIAM